MERLGSSLAGVCRNLCSCAALGAWVLASAQARLSERVNQMVFPGVGSQTLSGNSRREAASQEGKEDRKLRGSLGQGSTAGQGPRGRAALLCRAAVHIPGPRPVLGLGIDGQGTGGRLVS